MVQLKDLLTNNRITLLDVGAAGGLHPRFQALRPELKCVLFEPETTAFQALAESGQEQVVHNFALDETAGERTLHVTTKRECSSFFLPRQGWLSSFPVPERFTVEQDVSVKTLNLDSLLEEHPEVDFIKADAQGGELAILRGGQRMLQSVLGLEIEVEFNGIYQQQPLFADVDGFLRALGFELFDLRRYRWCRKTLPSLHQSRGQIIFGDALYFKSLDALESEQVNTARLKRLIAILLVYHRNDYALEVLERFAQRSDVKLVGADYNSLAHLCEQYENPKTLPDFRGKGRIRALLLNLLKTGEWYSADEEF